MRARWLAAVAPGIGAALAAERMADPITMRGLSIAASLGLLLAVARAGGEDRDSDGPAPVGTAEQFSDLFEQSRDAVYICDRDGNLLAVNSAFYKMFAIDPESEEAADLNAKRFYQDPADRARLMGAMDATGSIKDYELGLRRVDGVPITVLVTSSVRCDRSGNPVGYQGILRDVTERRRLEAELRQAQKMEALGHLAGGVAHDFNNLLMGIDGFTELALRQLGPQHPASEDLRHVRTLADRAKELVRRLLAFGRRSDQQLELLDLAAMLRDAGNWLGRVLGEQVRVCVHEPVMECPVRADRAQMEQVLLNLAINARDAMPDGGELHLRVECDLEARRVLMRVRDTGSGIDEPTRQRIFEPFFTTKGRQGTGLGLAVVYGIVVSHGGEISVASEPGGGTEFTVSLPVAEAGEGQQRARLLQEQPPGMLDGIVLLTEDDAAVRGVVERQLRAAGLEVLTAGTATEAERIAARTPAISLLITDVILPGRSGPELYRDLQAQGYRFPVLFMSGYPGDRLQRSTVDPDAVLVKPFTAQALLERIRQLLG